MLTHTPEALPTSSRPEGRPVILVVDDCPDTTELFSMLVSGLCAGYHIISATNAADGLDEARAVGERLKLVFVDASMPVHDGFWLVEQLRADSTLAHVPAYLATGHERLDLRNLGIKGTLVKPVSVSALQLVIETEFPTDLSRFS